MRQELEVWRKMLRKKIDIKIAGRYTYNKYKLVSREQSGTDCRIGLEVDHHSSYRGGLTSQNL